MANKKEVWDRFSIIAAVQRKNSTLRHLSRINGLSMGACSAALFVAMPKANNAIAEFLDIPLHELWPNWYAKNGDRILSSTHSSRKSNVLHSKIGEAA